MLDIDRLRIHVYDVTLTSGRPPMISEMAAALETSEASVGEALIELSSRRVLVLQPHGEILMAPPFSAVPTQHSVKVGDRTFFANCCWDSLGIPAALHAEAEVFSRCEQTLEPIHLRVGREGPVDPEPVVAHFAVPAARWWADLVYT